MLGRQQQALDGVCDVRGRGAVAPAVDPREPSAAHEFDDLRQQRRVADSPHKPRAQRDGLKAIAGRAADELLGARLRRAV